MTLAAFPSPAQAVWHLGPLPIRAYALCIVAGIVVAVLLTRRRWVARGGRADDVIDVAVWAVPFGIIGGRLYHVVTDPELYFAPAGKRSAPSTSGTAVSGSGARWPWAHSAPGWAAGVRASA